MPDEPVPSHLSRRSDAMEPTTVALRPVDRTVSGKRWGAVVRRWFRDTFSREQLVSGLRSLIWVAPLTVLIWIYAEREQVDHASAQFPIEIRSGAPGQVAHMADSRAGTVMATIRGPKAKVGQAVEALQAGNPVQIFVGGGRQPGYHDIDIPALIERDPRLRDNGLTVITCEPRMLRVKIDALREEPLDVKVRPEVTRLLNGPPLFDPPKVKVSAPASALDEAKGNAYVEAEIPPDLRTPGRHGPVSVRINIVGLAGPDVTLRQSNVNATIDVRDADEKFELKSVPVKVMVFPDVTGKYNVIVPKFVQNVTVYGSPDRIRQLKAGEIGSNVVAWLNITSADTTAGKGSRKPDYLLPDGISIRDEDKQPISFEITPAGSGQ